MKQSPNNQIPLVRPWFLRSRFRLFSTLFLLLAIPTGILTLLVAFYVRSELKEQSLFQNALTARLVSESLSGEFYSLRKYVEDFSRRSKLIEATANQDPQLLRTKLAELVSINLRFSRAFVTDSKGTLLTDYPVTTNILGKNFAHRDWYKGASAINGAYISEIYRRENVDRTNSVTVCCRIEDQGKVVGYLGAQLTTDQLLRWLKEVGPSTGASVFMLDQNHLPVLPGRKEATAFLESEGWQSIFTNTESASLITHPETNEKILVNFMRVPTSNWTVAAIQSMENVFKPVQAVLKTIGVFFLLCLAATAAIGFQWHKTLLRYEEHQEQVNEKLQTQAVNLKRSNDELQAVCYSIAHDLRGPLRGVRGLAIALREDYFETLDDIAKDYVQRLDSSAARMDELTRDLLEYGRLSHLEVRSEPVSLEAAVEKVLLAYGEEIASKEAQLEIKRPLPKVNASAVILEQVLANLVSNALKFVAEGVKPCIRIWAEETQQTVVLHIKDNGIGIDPAHQKRIFGVFERLHKVETYPGTGIGLAIVRRGIERLGGQVTLESAPGQGSCFSIELPKA